jgi:hypothetical protein
MSWRDDPVLSADIPAVAKVESNNNPNAVSPKGARGTMQVMPGTNTQPGYGVIPARDSSEAERTRVGEDYISALQQKYGREGGLQAYNMGPGAYEKWKAGKGSLPAETAAYAPKVLGVRNGGKAQPAWASDPVATDEPDPPSGPQPDGSYRVEVRGVGNKPVVPVEVQKPPVVPVEAKPTVDSSPAEPAPAQSSDAGGGLVESVKRLGTSVGHSANDLLVNSVVGAGKAMSYPIAPIDAIIDKVTGRPIGTGHKERMESLDSVAKDNTYYPNTISSDVVQSVPEALLTKDVGGKGLLRQALVQGAQSAVKAGIDQGDVVDEAEKGAVGGAAGHVLARTVGGAKGVLSKATSELVDKGYLPRLGEMTGPLGKAYDAVTKHIPGMGGATYRTEKSAADSYNKIVTREAAEKAANINSGAAAGDASARAATDASNQAKTASYAQAKAAHAADVTRIQGENKALIDQAKADHAANVAKIKASNDAKLAAARAAHEGNVNITAQQNADRLAKAKSAHEAEVARITSENEAKVTAAQQAHGEATAAIAAENQAKVAAAQQAHGEATAAVTASNQAKAAQVAEIVPGVTDAKEAAAKIARDHAKAVEGVELPAFSRWASTNKAVKTIREQVPDLPPESQQALNDFIKNRVMGRGGNSLGKVSGKEAMEIDSEIADQITAHGADSPMGKSLAILRDNLKGHLTVSKGAIPDSLEQLKKAEAARARLEGVDTTHEPLPKPGKVELSPLPKPGKVELSPLPKPEKVDLESKPKFPAPQLEPRPQAPARPATAPIPKAPSRPALDRAPPSSPRVAVEAPTLRDPKPSAGLGVFHNPIAAGAAGVGMYANSGKVLPLLMSGNPLAVAGVGMVGGALGVHQALNTEVGRKMVLNGLAGAVPDSVLGKISGMSGPEARKALEKLMASPQFANVFANMGQQLNSGG